MKETKYTLLFLLFFLILLTSCQSSSATNKNPLKTSDTSPMIILFSDENSIDKEANYYDALLEIQKNYRNESLPFQFVYSNNKEAVEYFQITSFPTLIILDTDETILLRLEKSHTKEEIVKKILAVSKNKKESQ